MDFDKIRPAVESIELSDKQKEDILNTCKGRKRKFNYKPLAAVAAVLFVTVAFYGLNGTLFGAKMADTLENEMLIADEYVYSADEDPADFQNSSGESSDDGKIMVNQSASVHISARPIYKIIPSAFSNLVDEKEFEEWQSCATIDNGMLMVQFVEHFGISKSDFEKANAAYALELEKIYGETASVNPEKGKEHLEIFNSDIIYSFDRTVIDGYYFSE